MRNHGGMGKADGGDTGSKYSLDEKTRVTRAKENTVPMAYPGMGEKYSLDEKTRVTRAKRQ